MSSPVFISVPAHNHALVEELKRELAPYARINQPPAYRDLNTVKLVLEIIGQSVGIAGGVAGIFTFLWNLKDRAAKEGKRTDIALNKPGKPVVMLDDADEALLRQLLEDAD